MRLAAVLSAFSGLAFVAMAVPSVLSGHGSFSWQIAAMLACYGLLLIAGGILLWRGATSARGGVTALALLNGFVAGQYPDQPLAWVLLVASAITVACGVWASVLNARENPPASDG